MLREVELQNRKTSFLKNIDKCVFWDCDIETLDFSKSQAFIISRTLMRGTEREIGVVEKLFSLEEIIDAVERSPEADNKCKNYYKTLQRLRNDFKQ
ncbi:MAG: hypothetical protein Q4G08_00280 [Capnocytophaga sp.]|nr:hypothetical protein [Capnocytophaga sp.]